MHNYSDVSALLSPYHLVSSDDADKSVLQLENQILFPSDKSMPFAFVAERLENAYENPSTEVKQNTAVILTQDAIQCSDNPVLELYTLLRLCLPSQDNRSVYGFKTYRLIKSFAKALEKCGGISGKTAAAQLTAWIKRPVCVKRNNALICMPEVAIAHAHAVCFPLHHSKAVKELTIRDVGSLCQRLTDMYKEKHKEVVLATGESGSKSIAGIKVDKIAEVLAGVLPRLTYTECKVLVRVLLRSVTMGIGVKTFTGALGPGWENRLDYQMDLGRLGMDYIKAAGGTFAAGSIICGVPFHPMTCNVISSPYVMKWLFGKEEKVKAYLPPKDGRLVVHSNGSWYIPLKRSNSSQRKRFFNLETSAPNNYTLKHMRILREIKKHKALFLNEAPAYGMVISYILSETAVKNSFLFMIRGMKTVEESEVEFVDASVEYDIPKYYNERQVRGGKQQKESDAQHELLRAIVIRPDKPQSIPGPFPIVITASTILPGPSSPNAKVEAAFAQGMIVQRKYDGDRMQAHLSLDKDGKPKVRLYSKKGKPVHHLYTDVAKELENKLATDHSLGKEIPCILDGEIIVVDSKDQTPLPWSSTKWRYDSGRGGVPLEKMTPSSSSNGVVSIITEGKYGENLDDGEDAPVSLAKLGPLRLWDQLGSNERKKLRVKAVEGAQLLFVVFDMVMYRGKNIATQSYTERLVLLKKLGVLSRLTFSLPIQESYYIQNAQQLVMELTKAVRTKSEGLILKDPAAPYTFGKTSSQRKLKICGPDINCAVGGFGFTLSKNPRMWGILTAVFSEDMKEFLVYNRVESIEGDSPSTAAEHILSLPSCIPADILTGGGGNPEVDVGKYTVLWQRGAQDGLRVTWRPKDERDIDYECTLCFACGLPQDIQWLCNPLECTFGVSQRGDLHPISYDLPSSFADSMWVPRFPVCRIQLDDHQRSECDTPSSIAEKFKQAAAEATCIQGFLQRKIKQLRSKPPRQDKLEELRRILLGKENQTEAWPQTVDAMYRLDDFSKLLVDNGFEPLTQGERHVLGGGNISSQWDPMLTKKIQIVESEETMMANDKREASLPFLSLALRRFKRLKSSGKLNPPIVPVRTATNMSASTKSLPPHRPSPVMHGEKKANDQSRTVFTLPILDELQSIPYDITSEDEPDCDEEGIRQENAIYDRNGEYEILDEEDFLPGYEDEEYPAFLSEPQFIMPNTMEDSSSIYQGDYMINHPYHVHDDVLSQTGMMYCENPNDVNLSRESYHHKMLAMMQGNGR